ncbi:MAG: thiolase family protein, partial [Chloroflexota bacterium]|nr:thiolase family protein [Chloroflexota bacterium]
PDNPSGGQHSTRHPRCRTAAAHHCEITWQMRGQAGDRQVPDYKAGMAHVIGLGSACTVHILTK